MSENPDAIVSENPEAKVETALKPKISINLKYQPPKQDVKPDKPEETLKQETLKNLEEKITLEKHKAANSAKLTEKVNSGQTVRGEEIQTLQGRELQPKKQNFNQGPNLGQNAPHVFQVPYPRPFPPQNMQARRPRRGSRRKIKRSRHGQPPRRKYVLAAAAVTAAEAAATELAAATAERKAATTLAESAAAKLATATAEQAAVLNAEKEAAEKWAAATALAEAAAANAAKVAATIAEEAAAIYKESRKNDFSSIISAPLNTDSMEMNKRARKKILRKEKWRLKQLNLMEYWAVGLSQSKSVGQSQTRTVEISQPRDVGLSQSGAVEVKQSISASKQQPNLVQVIPKLTSVEIQQVSKKAARREKLRLQRMQNSSQSIEAAKQQTNLLQETPELTSVEIKPKEVPAYAGKEGVPKKLEIKFAMPKMMQQPRQPVAHSSNAPPGTHWLPPQQPIGQQFSQSDLIYGHLEIAPQPIVPEQQRYAPLGATQPHFMGPPGVDQPHFEVPAAPGPHYAPQIVLPSFALQKDRLPDMPQNLFPNNVAPKRKYPSTPIDDRKVIAEPVQKKMTINVTNSETIQKKEDFNTFELDSKKYFTSTLDRPEIRSSTDESVRFWRSRWPWQEKLEGVDPLSSKTSSAILQNYADRYLHKFFDGQKGWVKVSVKGYPQESTMEEVMHCIMTAVKCKMIPCFIEFTPYECKFLMTDCVKVIKSLIRLQFKIDISRSCRLQIVMAHLNQEIDLDIIKVIAKWVNSPKLFNETKMRLDLSNFLGVDRCYLIFFPLSYAINQRILMQCRPHLSWPSVKELDLSNNRLESITDFKLQEYCIDLSSLDLSNNILSKISDLKYLQCLPLTSLVLEGNPLCWNYTDPDEYVELARMIFPLLKQLDGVDVTPRDYAEPKKYFSVDKTFAPLVVDKFLQTYFPLLDSKKDRHHIEQLYHENSTLSMTCDIEMKREKQYEALTPFFGICLNKTRFAPDHGIIEHASRIAKRMQKWPQTLHDYSSFDVDIVAHNDEFTTVIVNGIFKVPSISLVSDEPIVRFARTFVLRTLNGAEYKIFNDLFYIRPSNEHHSAYFIQQIKPLEVNLKLEAPPSEELKEELIGIFMKITKSKRKLCETCLEMRNWDLKEALEYVLTLEV